VTVPEAAFWDTEDLRVEGLEYCGGAGDCDLTAAVDVGGHGRVGVAELSAAAREDRPAWSMRTAAPSVEATTRCGVMRDWLLERRGDHRGDRVDLDVLKDAVLLPGGSTGDLAAQRRAHEGGAPAQRPTCATPSGSPSCWSTGCCVGPGTRTMAGGDRRLRRCDVPPCAAMGRLTGGRWPRGRRAAGPSRQQPSGHASSRAPGWRGSQPMSVTK
jgi:hypothetical protein